MGERYIGFDTGFARLGWGIVEKTGSHQMGFVACGCIETYPSFDYGTRLLQLENQIIQIISHYGPTHAAAEELFFNKNVNTAMNVAGARGIIHKVCASQDLPIRDCKGQEWKSLLGLGNTKNKKLIQRTITQYMGLATEPKPDDAADGIGISIWLFYNVREEGLLANG